jgi:hypothetical protein
LFNYTAPEAILADLGFYSAEIYNWSCYCENLRIEKCVFLV